MRSMRTASSSLSLPQTRRERTINEGKTYVEDVDRNMYDFRNDEKDAYRIKNGLTEDIVEKISEEKHDPEWMHDFRLNSLKIYHEMKVPDWGPSIEGLNMDNIATYVRAEYKDEG